MINNYKILCYKFEWEDVEQYSECNFFNTENTGNLIGTVDLVEYLTDINSFKYTFNDVSEDGKLNLYNEASNFSLVVSGIKDNSILYDFFEIGTDVFFVKYKIKVTNKNTNEVIYEGIIAIDSIKEKLSPSEDQKLINLEVLGMEKEFANYFNNVKIPIWNSYDGWVRESNLHDFSFNGYQVNYWGQNFISLMYKMFNESVTILTDPDIEKWRVINYPYLNSPTNHVNVDNNFIFQKTGLNNLFDKGETVFGFFSKLCNSMGWIFYIKEEKLYIKNRSLTTPVLHNLNKTNIKDIEISKNEPNKFDSIILLDGIIRARISVAGVNVDGLNRFYLITNNNFTEYSNIPFNNLDSHANFIVQGKNNIIEYYNEDEELFRYNRINYKWNEPTKTLLSININDSLRIDGGESGGNGSLYFSYRQGGGWGGQFWISNFTDLQNNEICYSGNYGNILYKIENRRWISYQDYVKPTSYSTDSLFMRNYQKYFKKHNAIILNVTIKYVLNGLFDTIIIDNYGDLNGRYAVVECEFDIKTDESKVKLQKIIE